jgi:hypothetical protein
MVRASTPRESGQTSFVCYEFDEELKSKNVLERFVVIDVVLDTGSVLSRLGQCQSPMTKTGKDDPVPGNKDGVRKGLAFSTSDLVEIANVCPPDFL